MVPCEFRCWGEYLSWQFTIGLCATLAEVEMSDPDTFASFFGLRNTAWAGHIRFKTQRASGGWWFRRGEDSGFVSKEKQKDACKRARFSLLEVLIAMAISSVLLLGAARFRLRYSVKV